MYSGRFKHFELRALPKGQHCDGKGLYLEKTSSDQGKWVYRFTLNRKQHRMGLGRYPEFCCKKPDTRQTKRVRLCVLA